MFYQRNRDGGTRHFERIYPFFGHDSTSYSMVSSYIKFASELYAEGLLCLQHSSILSMNKKTTAAATT